MTSLGHWGRGRRVAESSSSVLFAFAAPFTNHLALYLGSGASCVERKPGVTALTAFFSGTLWVLSVGAPQEPQTVPAPVGRPLGGPTQWQRRRPGGAPPVGGDPRLFLRPAACGRAAQPLGPRPPPPDSAGRGKVEKGRGQTGASARPAFPLCPVLRHGTDPRGLHGARGVGGERRELPEPRRDPDLPNFPGLRAAREAPRTR